MTNYNVNINISTRGAKKSASEVDMIGRKAKKSAKLVDLFKKSIAGIGVAFVAVGIGKLAIHFTQLNRRLSQFATKANPVKKTFDDLLKVANLTSTRIGDTVESYSRLTTATSDLGFSHKKVIGLVTQINKLLQISGSTTAEAAGGTRQFTQAIASGVLRGEEFNSVMENTPALARALADGLGVGIGKLREMSQAGVLTRKKVLASLEKMSSRTNELFSKLTDTPVQAFTRLRNNVIATIGSFDSMFGITTIITQLLSVMADNTWILTAALGAVAGVAVAAVVPAFNLVTAAIRRITLAMLANPIGAAVIIISASVGALIALWGRFRDSSIELGENQVTMANVIRGAWVSLGGSRVVQKISATWSSFGEFMGRLWDSITAIIKRSINIYVALFIGYKNSVIAIVGAVPAILKQIGIAAANALASAIGTAINAIIAQVNALSGAINNISASFGGGTLIKLIDPVDLTNLFGATDATKQMKDAAGGVSSAFASAFGVDYVGNFATATTDYIVNLNKIGATADKTAKKLNSVTDPTTKTGITGGGGGGGKSGRVTEIQLIGKALTALNEPFSQAKTVFGQLKQMYEDGVIGTEQYASGLDNLKDAFTRAGGNAKQFSVVVGDATASMKKSFEQLAEKSIGDLSDAFVDLLFTGKSSFKELAISIVKSIAKIIAKALLLNFVKTIFGGVGFKDGGSFGSSGNVTANATGNAFANGGTFTNSVVNTPTPFRFSKGGAPALGLMGEAGPEAIMPLKRGKNGRLGVELNGGGNSGGVIQQSVNVIHDGSTQIEYRETSKSDIEIIARRVVVSDAPGVIAREVGNPTSDVSQSLSRSTRLQRKGA